MNYLKQIEHMRHIESKNQKTIEKYFKISINIHNHSNNGVTVRIYNLAYIP